MAEEALCVVAASARTPLGRTLVASAAAVRAGLARFERDPELRDVRGRRIVSSRVCWLPSDLPADERLARLARPAAFQALSVLHGARSQRIGAFIGVSAADRPGRPGGVDAAVRGAIEQAVARHARLSELVLVAREHASGLIALQLAMQHLREGRSELCLVGGVDSYLDEDTIAQLERDQRMRSSRQRFGFTPGEGSGFLLLARRDACALPALALVPLVAHAVEPGRIARAVEHEPPVESSPADEEREVVSGEALAACFQQVIAGAGTSQPIDRLIGDLNGEPHRADELGMTLVRAGRTIARPIEVLAPASSWGDVGAASGPLAIGLAVAALERGWGARRTLIFSSSDAGERAAALLCSSSAEQS